jgi:membrane dipeptidase
VRPFLSSLCLLLLAAAVSGAESDSLEARARAIHQRVFTFDTHVDIPLDFATSAVSPADAPIQVNLDNMEAGGLDGAFFVVYTGQTPWPVPTHLPSLPPSTA